MRFVRVLVLAALFAALAVTESAQAQIVQSQFWGTNGQVEAVAVANNTIYLGGTFDQIGPPTGSFLGFDATTAAALQPYPGVVGAVAAIVSDGAGGWYIGGTFSSVQGQPRDGLARIDASGNVTAFGSDFSMTGFSPAAPEIAAIVVAGSTVYVGGTFGSIEGQARSCAAAFDATTGALTTWNPSPSYSPLPNAVLVDAMINIGGTIYAGGIFDAVGGQSRNNIAALDATSGAATAWNPNINGGVLALGSRTRDRFPFTTTVYAGGAFTSVGSLARNNVAEIDAGTAVATSWAPVVNNTVASVLPLTQGPVYIGGYFTAIGATQRNHIGAIDLSGTVTGWDPNANDTVTGFAILGNTLYACGTFTTMGVTPRNGLAAIDLTTGVATNWDAELGSSASAVVVGSNSIFAGGAFTIAGGVTRNGLAALDATTGLPTNWTTGVGLHESVVSMALNGDKLYLGGHFNSVGGVPRHGAAAVDLNTGAVTGWNPVVGALGVNALAASGNTIYVGGDASAGGYLAAFDATTGNPTSWNPPPSDVGGVSALLVSHGRVYVAGAFRHMGGLPRNHFAAVDTSAGALTSWDPQVTGSLALGKALASDGVNIWIGGQFDHAGGRPRDNLAAVDPIDGRVNTWDDYATGQVLALMVDGSTLYAAGQFGTLGGVSGASLGGVDITNGAVRPWGAGFDGGGEGFPGLVDALAASAGRIFAAGSFPGVNGYAHSNFAVLSAATTAVDPVARGPASASLRAWPNPFKSGLALRFAQPAGGDLDVAIYDVSGRLVRQLHRGPMPSGATDLEWDGRDGAGARVSTGVYIVRAKSGDRTMSAKVLRLE